jgi:NAD(P)-dependent dehydrogenase (short-subunit alcohol dehydrogenase family)
MAAFNPATDIPALAGKVILVTGGMRCKADSASREHELTIGIGNTGLGKQTIAYLAAHSPARIYLAARTASKATSAIKDIEASVPDASIEHLPLDLTSFSSIASAAQTFTAKEARLDILINNAGIMATPYSLTEEGYEIQFGTNHMGHALLTKLLLPVLQETAKEPNADVRIVNLTSLGHHMAPSGGIIWDQAALSQYATWRRYGQSKLANILFTHELGARYPAITSVSVHPGVILTELYTSINAWGFFMKIGLWVWGLCSAFLPGHYKDTKGGALNQTWAATVDKRELENGGMYMPVGKLSGGSGYSRDAGLAKKLWEWTEEEFGRHGY